VAAQATAVQMDVGGLHARSRRSSSSRMTYYHIPVFRARTHACQVVTALLVEVGHVRVVAPSPVCDCLANSRHLAASRHSHSLLRRSHPRHLNPGCSVHPSRQP
jgi:hypothetical protein